MEKEGRPGTLAGGCLWVTAVLWSIISLVISSDVLLGTILLLFLLLLLPLFPLPSSSLPLPLCWESVQIKARLNSSSSLSFHPHSIPPFPPSSHKPVSYQLPTSPKVPNLQRIGGSEVHAREPLHHDNHQGEARSQGKPALQSLPSLKTTGNTTRRIQRNNAVHCGIGGHCMPWEYKVQDLNQWHRPSWLWQTLHVQLLIRNPLKTFENRQTPKHRPSNDGVSTGHIQLLSCLILSVPEGRQDYPQVTDNQLNFSLFIQQNWPQIQMWYPSKSLFYTNSIL